MAISAVFFDAGHTLLYPHPPVGDVYAREAARFGARVDGEALGRTFAAVFKSFMRRYEAETASDEQDRVMWRSITRRVQEEVPALGEIDFERWFERLYDVFGHAAAWRVYPDVEPALAMLRERGLKLGVISNWDRRLRTIVREMGLESRFDRVTISAEEGVRKPDPRIFERALRGLGVAPGEAIHVGDLFEDDVMGARGAGLRGVLIDRGRAEVPDGVEVVRDLRDLAVD